MNITKKKLKSETCRRCEGTGIIGYVGRPRRNRKSAGAEIKCPVCDGTGIYEDYQYIYEINGQAIDGDTLK